MAAKKATKSSASKKTNTRGKSTAKRAKSAPAPSGMNPQVKAILLCAVGALMLALVIIPGGAFWKTMRSFLFGVFGVCSILVPMVFIYLGIMTAKEKQMAHKGAKVALSVLIVVMVCTLVYLFGKTDYNENNTYFSALGAAYSGSFALSSLCGFLGAVLGYPMRALLTNTPSVIICFIVLIVSFMVLFGVTLVDIANVAKKGYRKTREQQQRMREHHQERAEIRRREREEREEQLRREQEAAEAFDYPDYTTAEPVSRGRSNSRIDIPLDKSEQKPRQKNEVEIAEDQHDQDIIDIINNANSGIIPDEEEEEIQINYYKLSPLF